MLTGDPPLDESNVATVAQRHLEEKALPFKKLRQLPKPFQRLILQATARYPQQRFTSVGEFARAIPGTQALDHSAEFSKLLAHQAAREMDETPMPDVFSGKGYIEHPEDSGELWADLGPRQAANPRQPITKKESATRERPKPRSSRRDADLRVDFGKVRREELKRDREVRRTSETPRLSDTLDLAKWAQYSASFVVGLIGFHMLGSWVAGAVVVKIGLGLSPLIAAYIWIMFSPFRRVHGGLHERIFAPMARAWMASVGIAWLAGMLIFPTYAAGATRVQSRWLVGESGPLAAVFGGAIDALSGILTRLFAFSAGVVPW
jgi:hypothetical protein